MLPPSVLAQLAGLVPGPGGGPGEQGLGGGAGEQRLGGALRLARYVVKRVDVVQRVAQQLATIPEAVEMARCVGLTIWQVCFGVGFGGRVRDQSTGPFLFQD